MEEETTSYRDWPASRFFLKCYDGYISHTKLDPLDPSDQMLKGGEEHNIPKTKPNSMVKYKDMVAWVFALKVLSLSLSLSHTHTHISVILGIFYTILLIDNILFTDE